MHQDNTQHTHTQTRKHTFKILHLTEFYIIVLMEVRKAKCRQEYYKFPHTPTMTAHEQFIDKALKLYWLVHLIYGRY